MSVVKENVFPGGDPFASGGVLDTPPPDERFLGVLGPRDRDAHEVPAKTQSGRGTGALAEEPRSRLDAGSAVSRGDLSTASPRELFALAKRLEASVEQALRAGEDYVAAPGDQTRNALAAAAQTARGTVADYARLHEGVSLDAQRDWTRWGVPKREALDEALAALSSKSEIAHGERVSALQRLSFWRQSVDFSLDTNSFRHGGPVRGGMHWVAPAPKLTLRETKVLGQKLIAASRAGEGFTADELRAAIDQGGLAELRALAKRGPGEAKGEQRLPAALLESLLSGTSSLDELASRVRTLRNGLRFAGFDERVKPLDIAAVAALPVYGALVVAGVATGVAFEAPMNAAHPLVVLGAGAAAALWGHSSLESDRVYLARGVACLEAVEHHARARAEEDGALRVLGERHPGASLLG